MIPPGIVTLPQVTWRPLPITRATITPSSLIAHTAVSGANSLWSFFDGPSGGIDAHFYLRANGSAEQYISVEQVAQANGSANRWWDPVAKLWRGAVSVESWDNGAPDTTPWTLPQLKTLSDLAHWLHDRYAMPLELCATPHSPGIGFHSMWPHPNPWSPAGHSCPGPTRIAQFTSQLVPLINRQELKQAMISPTLTELDGYVANSYHAAGNLDQHGQRGWVRKAAMAADLAGLWVVLSSMDAQLGL